MKPIQLNHSKMLKKWSKPIVTCTYFKCDSSCLDNEIIDRHFDFFWKEKEWISDFCNTYIRPADLDPSDQDLAAAASVSSCPLMQYQTVMNAAIGIIHDLTVKSFRPWTMRVRKNNRGERIPRYTHHLMGQEWPLHFLHHRDRTEGIYRLFGSSAS